MMPYMCWNEKTVDLFNKEIALEAEASLTGRTRFYEQLKGQGLGSTYTGRHISSKMEQVVCDALTEYVRQVLEGKAKRKAVAAVALNTLDLMQIAVITCRTIVNIGGRSGNTPPTSTKMAMFIGKAVKEHADYMEMKAVEPNLANFINRKNKKATSKRHKQAVVRAAVDLAGVKGVEWDAKLQASVGLLCLEVFIKETGLMKRVTKLSRNRQTTYVEPTEEFSEWLTKSLEAESLLSPLKWPMAFPPSMYNKQWKTPHNGAYLDSGLVPLNIISSYSADHLQYLEGEDFSKVYKALNAIQNTPWRINQEILKVAQGVWDMGGGMAGLPKADMLDLPPKPFDIDTNEESRKEWKKKASTVYAENGRLVGKRTNFLTSIAMAKRYSAFESIYFPHNLDFRGRIYPVMGSSGVSPQGDDLGKALLEFSEGKPLGETGGFWLAVHLANVWGEDNGRGVKTDKMSLEDRALWTQNNSDWIKFMAKAPLDFTDWMNADKPFSFLAACIEWCGFLEEGESYVSRIAVAMDGSCSGIQHYSALLKDEVGASAVNLVPAELPQDIYNVVAQGVSKRVAKDAAKGNSLAEVWVGKIDRSICKQPVMTLPYGVSKRGMVAQVMSAVKKKSKRGKDFLGDADVMKASEYLTNCIWDVIAETVVAARQGMDWLKEAALVLGQSGGKIRWETPLGFPVVHRYKKSTAVKARIYYEGEELVVRVKDNKPDDDIKKSAQAVAPNYIHSMDAAHLQSTVLLSLENGITNFAMIHDSFGTHACNTGLFNEVLRESFVRLYENENWLERLKEVWERQGALLPDTPNNGRLEVSRVRESDFFFS